MIQLRWLNQNGNRILQYRQIVDKTVRALPAGPFGTPVVYHTPWGQMPPVNQTWDWTDWTTVPEVTEPTPTHDPDKCPKCGLDLKGAISYTCIQPNCPTGLGGSFC